MTTMSRRQVLQLAQRTGIGLLGVALSACAPAAAPASTTSAKPASTSAPAQTTAAATGGPWFRDPSGETSLQLFNTITPIGYINTSSVAPDELKSIDDLVNPKWKGKLASYDPSVNGGGLIAGSVIYTVKGADFAKQLYQGQEIAYTRDYQQIADWVAHDSYPIGLAITPVYMNQYQGTVPVQELVLPDLPTDRKST